MTIAELEEQGYTVKFSHGRLGDRELEVIEKRGSRLKKEASRLPEPKHRLRAQKRPIAPRGGFTKAVILKGEEVVAEAEAWCNTIDNFNKRLGREIALGRAVKQMRETATV